MKTPAIIISIASIFALNIAKAQDQQRTSIAIVPFKSTIASDSVLARLVQSKVAECFTNDRFYSIDRTKLNTLLEEIRRNQHKEFENSPKVIDAGKQIGAEYIVSGTVSPLDIQAGTTSKIDPLHPSKLNNGTNTIYNGTLRVQLQIDKVETGASFFNKSITVTSTDFSSQDKNPILDNSLCRLGKNINANVMQMFTPDIVIAKVEKESGGYPEEVLITAGDAMFGKTSKETPCPGETDIPTGFDMSSAKKGIKSIFGSKTKILLNVIAISSISVNGKVLTDKHTIGELQVKDVRGELTLCKVTQGKKEIKGLMDSKGVYTITVKDN